MRQKAKPKGKCFKCLGVTQIHELVDNIRKHTITRCHLIFAFIELNTSLKEAFRHLNCTRKLVNYTSKIFVCILRIIRNIISFGGVGLKFCKIT